MTQPAHTAPPHPPTSPAPVPPDASRALLAAVPEATADALELYLRAHRDPELSGAEERTAALLAAHLTAAGYEVGRGVGGHGVVGVLRNGPGPTVMLRAELDALPVREQTGLPYASTATALDAEGREVPVMHACGHDLHLACAAGTAALLSRHREAWRGTVMVVGQPAEETLAGAAAMLADGLYERFAPGPPDAVLAQHSAPLPAGMVGHPTAAATAASACLRVLVHGRGGHAATPHLAVDPLAAAASIVLRLQTLVARETGPADPAVVSVGALHAGTSANLIPDEATLDLTIRAASDTSLDRLLGAVHRVVAAESAAAGCAEPPEVKVLSRAPANHPHRTLADAVLRAHRDLLGPARVALWPPSLATEDFGLFGPAGADRHGLPDVHTAYWMFGVVGKKQWDQTPGATALEKLAALPPNHSPRFRPDPASAIPAGIRTLSSAALAAGLAAPAVGKTTGPVRVTRSMTVLGLIGSGLIGGTVAKLAVDAGVDVVLSNSRGPETLADLAAELGPRARAATAEEAARAGDLVVVTVPFGVYRQMPREALAGKVVLDTNNYYPERDGAHPELDTRRTTSSGLLQQHLDLSHVVKVFNNIFFKHLAALPRPTGAPDRSALPIAGDDEEAKSQVTALLDQLGYDTVDAGPLAEGWRFQPGTPAYGPPYAQGQGGDFAVVPAAPAPAAEIVAALAKATR